MADKCATQCVMVMATPPGRRCRRAFSVKKRTKTKIYWMIRITIWNWHWFLNIHLFHIWTEAIYLPLASAMAQIVLLPNTTPSVNVAQEVALVGSWNTVNEVWLALPHILTCLINLNKGRYTICFYILVAKQLVCDPKYWHVFWKTR